ncbi:hypothetical protein [Paenibacillus tyrfis]|uniref:hypothetical protein n=1 Tax=Paenibacillus tyrfis TaxID=1501230 RepID=UPI0020A058F9|nr:hypothetical protein [Paenibacillus tyrfis]MCP1306435.1 hypothetical protein [Paenibacillus tyrfis]
MAALQIQNAEQLRKAEELKNSLEVELRDPLLDDAEKSKLQTKVNRLNAAIQEYKDRTKPVDPVSKSEKTAIVLQEAAPPEKDPRPDLTEDAHLWAHLLLMALDKDKEGGRVYGEVDTLCGVLNSFRCAGTRLRAGKSIWVLKPDIDPTGRVAWESQAEYDDFKARYLQQWGDVIPELLKQLTRKHPLPMGE